MSDYELMHKNSPCGKIAFDDKSGRIISYKDNGNGYLSLSSLFISIYSAVTSSP